MSNKNKSYLWKSFLTFLITLPIVSVISLSFGQYYIIPWLIWAILLSSMAVSWRYQKEINSWYETRLNCKAERKGKEIGLHVKIKMGKALINPPSSGGVPRPKWSFIKTRNIEIYCKGAGTKNDPFIIDGIFPIPNRVIIENDKHYYLLQNLKLKKIGLDGCENFTLKNCEFTEFRLNKCANINIKNTLIVRESRLKDCQNIQFENCLIKNMILSESNGGNFNNCFFVHLKDWMSSNNNYRNIKLEFLESNKKEENFYKENILKETDIKKSNYKLKKLFYTNLKNEFLSILLIISFVIFTLIGIGIVLELNTQGFDIRYIFFIIPGDFIYLILIVIIGFHLNELYFKIKLKKMGKKI